MSVQWAAPSYKFATIVDLIAVVKRGNEVLAEIHEWMPGPNRSYEDVEIDRAKVRELALEWLILSERFLHLVDALGTRR